MVTALGPPLYHFTPVESPNTLAAERRPTKESDLVGFAFRSRRIRLVNKASLLIDCFSAPCCLNMALYCSISAAENWDPAMAIRLIWIWVAAGMVFTSMWMELNCVSSSTPIVTRSIAVCFSASPSRSSISSTTSITSATWPSCCSFISRLIFSISSAETSRSLRSITMFFNISISLMSSCCEGVAWPAKAVPANSCVDNRTPARPIIV